MICWEPFQSDRCERSRATETSCCGTFEWVCQGGQFLILRHGERGYEEAGRGIYRDARAVWDELIRAHSLGHLPKRYKRAAGRKSSRKVA